jgi:hypothetical protein
MDSIMMDMAEYAIYSHVLQVPVRQARGRVGLNFGREDAALQLHPGRSLLDSFRGVPSHESVG